MSRLFNQVYFENPEQWEREQGYKQRQIDEAWERWELEQQNQMTEDLEQSFVLEDGTILFDKPKNNNYAA